MLGFCDLEVDCITRKVLCGLDGPLEWLETLLAKINRVGFPSQGGVSIAVKEKSSDCDFVAKP